MTGKIRCAKCEYCKDYRRSGNTRGSFFCNHPDREYISKYFKEHTIISMEGFVGFSEPFSMEPALKGTPRWCPKKKGKKGSTQ